MFCGILLVLKLGAEHVEHLVNGFFLQVGFFYQHFARCVEHCLGGVETDALD